MQKLILGRILSVEPRLIVANQPTRGLDVGAIAYVHGRLLEARENGAGILLISEDLDEVLALADRIAVVYRGRLTEPKSAGEGDGARARPADGRAVAGGRPCGLNGGSMCRPRSFCWRRSLRSRPRW